MATISMLHELVPDGTPVPAVPAQTVEEDLQMKAYSPCRSGLHVCGADEDANEFFTEANHPLGPCKARVVFSRARDECAAKEGEPCDFVVDLMRGGYIVEDFAISRQMLPRLAGLVAAAAAI